MKEQRAKPSVALRSAYQQNRSTVEAVVCVGFLFLTVYALLRYITGPSLAFLHSDCTDSLLWAYATVETGEILTPEFHYAALLPFGAPLWMVPILKMFGYSVTAHVVSMCVFAVLFIPAAFSLFRAMKCRIHVAAGGTFLLSMLLSGSVKLREIMWEHVIYYSLSLLFLLVLLNLVLRLVRLMDAADRPRGVKAYVYIGILFLLCAGCATDGFQVLAISAAPVAAALIAVTFFDKRHPLHSRHAAKRYVTAGVMLVGAVLGTVLLKVITKGGTITAAYGSAYSTWSDMSEWSSNSLRFFPQYLSLFGVEVNASMPLFSGESILMLLRLVTALALLVCPALLVLRYARLRHTASRYVTWVHIVVSAVILLGFICGTLSGAAWRLTPMLGTAILATLMYLRELIGGERLEKRVAVAVTALLTVTAILPAHTMLTLPADAGDETEHKILADTLESMEYDYGYATFWNAQVTTLLADDAVRVLPINVNESGVSVYAYQTLDRWFDSGCDDCFLLLSADEYGTLVNTDYWASLTERRQIIDEFTCEGYQIVVFDGDVLPTPDA